MRDLSGPFKARSGEKIAPKNYLKKEKSLAQEVRQKNDISERRSKGWRGPLLATRPIVSLGELSEVILHQKWI